MQRGRASLDPNARHREVVVTQKLIIILANTDPRNCEELGAPIIQASVAAAMSYNVEVICTGTAAKLLKIWRRRKLHLKPSEPRSDV